MPDTEPKIYIGNEQKRKIGKCGRCGETKFESYNEYINHILNC